MSIAALVKTLLDAGVAADVVVAAVAAAESAVLSGGIPVDKVDETAERRRAYDRERKRKVRWNSTGVHRNSESAPLSIGLVEEEVREERKREAPATPRPPDKRGSRLPDDWMPTDEDAQFGASLGFTAAAYDREVQKFRNHWHAAPGKGGVKLDWGKTFRNWLLRGAEKFTPAAKGYTPTQVQTTEAVFIVRGSPQWDAWTKHRGREPIAIHHGGQDGQFMRTEWPPQENAA